MSEPRRISHTLPIALVFVAPVLLLAALYAVGHALGVRAPLMGRGYVIRIALTDPDSPLALPPVLGPQDRTRPLVVIDAGHGGHDPGAVGAGFQEKTLTLTLARALRDELLRGGGVRVALTRDDDRFLVLDERAEIARRLGADLLISLHADSAGDKAEISGASVYTLSAKASSDAAARVAARENSADVVNGVALANQNEAVNAILVDLSRRRTQEHSAEFADLVVREGKGLIPLSDMPLRSAAFVVLKSPDVASALFESGFISNPREAAQLASPAGQKSFAEALARAIRVYFARQGGA